MKIFFNLLLSVCFFQAQLQAQIYISGRVTDQKGISLPGANVFLEGTFYGTTTLANGNFSFSAPADSNRVLLVRFIGYSEYKQVLTLTAADSLFVEVRLKEVPGQLGEVVITAGSFEASDVNRAASLTTQDVLTTAAALGDVMGAIQLLPGTSSQAEDGRLFVRGGSAGESRLYINGMVVQNPYGASVQNMPARGRFSPHMFKGFRFSTGAYGAEWGDALSAVLTMDNLNMAEAAQQTDFSLMTVGGAVAHQRPLKKGGLALALEYTNLRPYMALVPQQYNFHKAPAHWGGALLWQQELGKGKLLLLLDGRSGNLHLTQPDIREASGKLELKMENQNHYGQLRWQQPLTKRWVMTQGIALTLDHTKLQPNATRFSQRSQLLHFKSKFEGDLAPGLALNAGLEAVQPMVQEVFTEAPTATPLERTQQWRLYSAWAEADWQVARRLAVRAGLRAGKSSRSGQAALLPRFSMAWQLQETQQISLAAGAYRQEPEAEWLRVHPRLEEARSKHLLLNYQYQSEGQLLRAEAYYKRYDQLPLWQATSEERALLSATGAGYARGFELFWRDRKTFRRSDYWISYSFLDSRRQWADYPEAVTPPFALRHSLGMVYKLFVKQLRSQVGGSFSLTSGRPYENPNTAGFMNERAAVQQNLSLNWAWLWKQNLILYAAATNVFGGGKAYTYHYAAAPNAQGLYEAQAVGPSASRFFFVGLFFTLSHHQHKNQLDKL